MPKKPAAANKCATGPVKLAHLCELDYRTKVGSQAWYVNHTPKQRRLSALRALHEIYGTHENVRALTGHGSVARMHTKTMIRLVKEGQ